MLLSILSACNTEGGSSDTSSTESSSEEIPEDSTEMPRLDYFSADPFDYVELDRGAYQNLTLKLEEDFNITDEAVKNYIDSSLYTIKEEINNGDRTTTSPLKYGDAAFIFYRGEIDGKEFEGGSNMSDDAPFELHIGSKTFIDGFEDGLIGITPNQTSPENMHKINLTFPEDYLDEELAGKDVVFYVYVVYSVQYKIPEYNIATVIDTFGFNTTEQDVLGAYEKYIRSELELEAEKNKNTLMENKLWDILLKEAKVNSYPQEEIDFYFDAHESQMEYYFKMYSFYGIEYESFDAFVRDYMGLEKDADWKSALTDICREMVAQNLIYHAIAKHEGIEVTADDFDEEVMSYVMENEDGLSADQIIEEMGENAIKESALYKKVIFDFLIPSCSIEYDK